MQSVRSWANQTLESETTKTLFGSFATFLGASPDDAGGAELGWLFASVLQNAGNNLVKGGMHRVTLALAEDLRAHVTLLNLKVVTTYAKELVENLAEKPNRIIFSGKPITLTPESEILKSTKPLPATRP